MFCEHCGKALPEVARFCYSCGKPQAPSEEASSGSPDLPAQPYASLNGKAEANPGSSMEPETVLPSVSVKKTEAGSQEASPRTILYVAGGVLALILVVGGVLSQKQGGDDGTATSASSGAGFNARFECSMMGQPLPLFACIEMSSISVVTGSGVQEFNIMTLGQGRTDLDVDLPEHFQIRASNAGRTPASLRVTVKNREGRIVFSDDAGPGRSISLQN